MTVHIVTAAAVKVSIGAPGGNRLAQFLRRRDVVPAGLDEAQLGRLVERGLIAELPPIDPDLELAPTAVFDEAVKVEVARVIEVDFVPLFEKRVEEAAAKLVAEQNVVDQSSNSAESPIVTATVPAPAPKPRTAK